MKSATATDKMPGAMKNLTGGEDPPDSAVARGTAP
jgi:hypothetical protein